MVSKNQRPVLFTESQLHQLKRTTESLRKLNRAALRELRGLRFADQTRNHYRKAGDSFRAIATQMISLVQVRQGILIAGRKPQNIRVVFHFDLLCDSCSENSRLTEFADKNFFHEGLRQDPAHEREVEHLVELAGRTAELVWERCRSKEVPASAFFRGIARLTLALVRQQQQLDAMAPQPTCNFEFDDSPEGSDLCSECHKPIGSYTDEEARPTG